MEYRIMIVEDDPGIAGAIADCMVQWGLKAEAVSDFRRVMEDFARIQPHLVLLDITLPFMNGYHWCAEIRKVSSVPVIFISSASDNMNIIMSMNMGGDEFIAKPFDSGVLIAKVQALLRRTYDYAASAPVLEHRGAMLNTGTVVSREKLMEALWQSDAFVDENTLTVNVGRLRKKLDAAGLTDFISTKFGVGYSVG